MEYGVTVRDPYQKYNSYKVGRVQRRAARFIKSRYSRYSSVLMCWGWGVRLFLKGDRRLDLFCFTKLLMVWHKYPSKVSLLRRIRVLEENSTKNLDRLAIQLLISPYGQSTQAERYGDSR